MSRRSIRGAALLACALALSAAWPSLASADLSPRHAVQAEVTFHGSEYSATGVRLHIRRDGVAVVNRPPPKLCPVGCALLPVPKTFPEPTAQVVQLDRSPEPEALFTLYSGGAHCCVFGVAFRWVESSQRYLMTSQGFLDAGYELEDLRNDGVPLLVSSDNRLAYRFSCYACSRYPIQIWEFDEGRFVDVTRSFPRQVKRDLAESRRSYRRARGRGDVRGILATIVADSCLLDRCDDGFDTVRRAIAAGPLRPEEDASMATQRGHAYLRALRRFLGGLGYL
jgi:hypothetical protein